MPEIFKNAAELEKKFNQHGHAVRRQLLTKATKAGAELIQKRAEELAPRDTGQLAESELVRIDSSQSSAAEVVAKIGPSKDSFYGFFQEFGTAHHAAQPFLKPALEQTQAKAIEVSGEIVGEGLEKLG